MKTEENEVIQYARNGFEKDLFDPIHIQVTSDPEQLIKLTELCDLLENKYYLDLATGTGYVAFYLSNSSKQSIVYGIDIVEKAITDNKARVKNESRNNLQFMLFDGMTLPFKDQLFHTVICRYAFHHFPIPLRTINEIYRIVEVDGYCIVADPITSSVDASDFVNSFASLKNDGHVRYYRESELIDLFEKGHFLVDKKFYSTIRFPREMNQSYESLLKRTESLIQNEYEVEIVENKVYITLKVINIRFRRI